MVEDERNRGARGLMSRRGALRLVGGAALAAGTVGFKAVPCHAVARSPGVLDFQGTWIGSHDGRQATLSTAVAQTGADEFQVTCTLLDHVRAEAYVGCAYQVRAADRALTDIRLRGRRGGDEIVWRSLRINRWREDPVSGVGWWSRNVSGSPFFGLSFYRDPARGRTAAPAVAWHSGTAGGRADMVRTSFGVFDGPGDRFLLHLDRLPSPGRPQRDHVTAERGLDSRA